LVTMATSLERSQNERLINYPHPYVYQSWIVGRDRSSVFWDNWLYMPIFAFFTKVQKNKQTFFWSYCTELHQSCIRCSHIQCFRKSVWRKNFPQKRQNPTFVGCYGNVPWAIAKWMQSLSSPTNHWKVGEDPFSIFWELFAPRSTTKNI